MHSLISPNDRKSSSSYELKSKDPLSMEECQQAMKQLNRDITFTQVDRYYADPAQYNQNIALVSFVPSKGAKPDKDNIYGMMKVRGVYATEEEANERAEFLIKNVDSYHEIFHSFVGRPFPVTTSDVYANEIKKIDIRQKTTDIISEEIMNKKQKEKNDMMEIKEKEKKLLEESKRAQNNEPRDIFEEYITENVKRAQLIWTFHETKKKMEQMKDSYEKAIHRIREIDEIHPDYVNQYREKYMEARRESGIPDDNDSFIKYLGTDLSVCIEDAPNGMEK